MFDVTAKHYGPMHVYLDSSADYSGLVEALLPDPDLSLARGERLPGRGRRCVTAIVTLAGQAYLLKKYEYRNPWYGVRHLVKRSRALRVFVNQRSAWLAGVSTPEPLACLEMRRLGFLLDCYVLCRFVPGSRTLKDCWDELSDADRSAVLQLCGQQLGLLHRCGVTHGDSNWRNVLVTHAACAIMVWLIDFDGSSRPLILNDQTIKKDIAHFIRDMRWRKLAEEKINLFISARDAADDRTKYKKNNS